MLFKWLYSNAINFTQTIEYVFIALFHAFPFCSFEHGHTHAQSAAHTGNKTLFSTIFSTGIKMDLLLFGILDLATSLTIIPSELTPLWIQLL